MFDRLKADYFYRLPGYLSTCQRVNLFRAIQTYLIGIMSSFKWMPIAGFCMRIPEDGGCRGQGMLCDGCRLPVTGCRILNVETDNY